MKIFPALASVCKLAAVQCREYENRLFQLRPRPHTMEKFDHGVFMLKTQMFSVHTTPEKFENTTITGHLIFGFVFEKKKHSTRKITTFVTSSFSQSSNVFKMFSIHTNAKPAFLNSSGLKSVFEKPCFRDGLVWTVGETVEIKLRFQTSLA